MTLNYKMVNGLLIDEPQLNSLLLIIQGDEKEYNYDSVSLMNK